MVLSVHRYHCGIWFVYLLLAWALQWIAQIDSLWIRSITFKYPIWYGFVVNRPNLSLFSVPRIFCLNNRRIRMTFNLHTWFWLILFWLYKEVYCKNEQRQPPPPPHSVLTRPVYTGAVQVTREFCRPRDVHNRIWVNLYTMSETKIHQINDAIDRVTIPSVLQPN